MDGCGDEIEALHQLEVATQNGNELPLDHVNNISDVLMVVADSMGSPDDKDPYDFVAGVLWNALGSNGDVLVEVLSRDPACLPGTEVAPSQPLAMGGAFVEIVEQPAPKALRFRYECEGRSAGSIPGVNSKSDNRTYPTIRIHNYIGQVTIVVSCVTKDDPYKAHPHNLVGRERCERGVCTIRSNITAEANEYQFKNLGIQCVKRRDIADALQQRAALRVDPFRTGFEHRNNPQSIDLNAVRLAFQVFVPESNGRSMYQLKPVVSDIIFDKKAMCDLQIMRSSHCSGPVTGGTQIILLTEKIQREDTVVEFYQEEQTTGAVRWSAAANPVYVHRLTALVVETPPYNPTYFKQESNTSQIMVRFHLRRLSDKQCSNSLPFEYVPEYRDTKGAKRKAVMSAVMNYDDRALLPPVKVEPERSPPHIYSPPGINHPEPQQQWTPLEPMMAGSNPFIDAGAWANPALGANALGPGYAYAHGSPMGPVSPHHNLQSPISPHHSPQPQPLPTNYQIADTPMVANISALLNEGSEAPMQQDLFSISSLIEDRDNMNLSDSLRQLSTNDLFQQ